LILDVIGFGANAFDVPLKVIASRQRAAVLKFTMVAAQKCRNGM
jgi:hypothetical protein